MLSDTDIQKAIHGIFGTIRAINESLVENRKKIEGLEKRMTKVENSKKK